MLKKPYYIPALDGLRAVCITAVIALHVAADLTTSNWLASLVNRGWYGVDVFFVLSGFLITWILVAEQNRTGTIELRRFYVKRAFRIQPAYVTGLALNVAAFCLAGDRYFHREMAALPYLLTYTFNLALAFGLLTRPLYGVAWSLCIEEQFYLFWPWALRRFGQGWAVKFTLLVIGAVVLVRCAMFAALNWGHLRTPSQASLDAIYTATFTRIDTIFLGCLLALLLCRESSVAWWKGVASKPWIPSTTLALAAATIWLGTRDRGDWLTWTVGATVMAATVAGVLGNIVLQPGWWFERFLALPPLVFVGRVSYGMYLFHLIVWEAVHRLLIHGFHLYPAGKTLFVVAVVWLGSLLIAWAHFEIVEKRFMAMRERVLAESKPVAQPVFAQMSNIGGGEMAIPTPGRSEAKSSLGA